MEWRKKGGRKKKVDERMNESVNLYIEEKRIGNT